MLPLEAYMRERDRRCDRTAYRQRWRDLLFLHFAVEPSAIRKLLPRRLEIDTHPNQQGEEMAWVGLVPFRMEGVRHRLLPPIPGNSAFPETNVRTYVHLDGRPAVWFFSLDAASGLACRAARKLFHLPYWEASMTVDRRGDEIRYRSRRRVGDATLAVDARLSGDPAPAQPGTLEFFLVERYLLVTTDSERWFGGTVHHAPYQIRRAELTACEETLTTAAGIKPYPYIHRMFADGVDVRIGPLQILSISDEVTGT